jgi:hypothetical protein
MVTVDKDSANWRLFGGGGLAIGGLLWLIAVIVTAVQAGPVSVWLWIIGVTIVGAALFFVAFGETGSNGAVGASGLGKTVLVAFGLGELLLALCLTLAAVGIAPPAVLAIIAQVLVIAGGLLSAWAVYQRAVARGTARWVLFVPAVLGVVYGAVTLFGWSALSGLWLPGILAASFAATGVLYVLNSREIG